ncbi:unnamed protein product [Adineta steineri]|uniref:Flavodoxin-like domain-containing protein n=1 Tax=Adineta steineri TaxID=433720 RepID=A0A819RFX4_9BILA|nr:unnamed protein product [Adineta steineri]CAF1189078.1 unnamed protein product [Adineta steineri]CAF3910484.1 unnamed protein product [Adineta steineri]CAF4051669.1 unnamed protein product [Adineta steineri]
MSTYASQPVSQQRESGSQRSGEQRPISSSTVSQNNEPERRQSSRSTETASSRQHRSERRRPVIFVIYYSMYGHIERMAKEVCDGVESTGCECRLFQIAETLPAEVLAKMHAKEKNSQIPIIKAEQLPEADGIIFGIPTRFGSTPTQVRALFDQCGGHWMSDALFGKPVGVFFSTGSIGGGQETTALTCVTFFAHLGMIFVPLGYKNKRLQSNDEVHGGSAYGAGTLAGDGSRQPSELELDLAKSQGHQFAKVVKKLAR